MLKFCIDQSLHPFTTTTGECPKCLLPECFNIFRWRNAPEINTYTMRGDGSAIEYTPVYLCWWVLLNFVWVSLTSMPTGFRYIYLTNYPGTPDHNTLTAHFVHTGKFQMWIGFHTNTSCSIWMEWKHRFQWPSYHCCATHLIYSHSSHVQFPIHSYRW